jgi:hypothetical protein
VLAETSENYWFEKSEVLGRRDDLRELVRGIPSSTVRGASRGRVRYGDLRLPAAKLVDPLRVKLDAPHDVAWVERSDHGDRIHAAWSDVSRRRVRSLNEFLHRVPAGCQRVYGFLAQGKDRQWSILVNLVLESCSTLALRSWAAAQRTLFHCVCQEDLFLVSTEKTLQPQPQK